MFLLYVLVVSTSCVYLLYVLVVDTNCRYKLFVLVVRTSFYLLVVCSSFMY